MSLVYELSEISETTVCCKLEFAQATRNNMLSQIFTIFIVLQPKNAKNIHGNKNCINYSLLTLLTIFCLSYFDS